ncbi:MAG: hypothetical protein LBV30_03250, partial [Propionibacteriaceae bacterium]|nr:hypothetical protein [Propionibacteriaceae bacterium]
VLGDLSDPLVLASTTSEQVAWHEARQNHQDLVVVAPSTLIGPSAGPMQPAINQLLSRLVAGRRLTLPELAMDLVDLGDVAELICLALVTPRMAGERLLAGSGASIGWSGLVELLVGRLQALGRGEVVDRLRPLRRLGLPVSAMVANLWPAWRSALPFMGQSNSFDSSKAAYWLNWQSRSLSASLDDWLRVNLPTGLEINFEEGRGSDVDYQPAGGHSGFQAGTGAVADS